MRIASEEEELGCTIFQDPQWRVLTESLQRGRATAVDVESEGPPPPEARRVPTAESAAIAREPEARTIIPMEVVRVAEPEEAAQEVPRTAESSNAATAREPSNQTEGRGRVGQRGIGREWTTS